jgi:hypothetical protein
VVRPNFDTLYSSAWLDLSSEPMVVSVPDTGGRYYLLPMLDMWTDVVAVPGKRTSGTQAADCLVVPSGWAGQVPVGMDVIQAPTAHVDHRPHPDQRSSRLPGRPPGPGRLRHHATVTLGPGAGTGGGPVRPVGDMQTPPLEQVNAMSARDYFGQAAELLRLHPPHVTDWSMLARLARIGLRPGERLDYDTLDPRGPRRPGRGAGAGLALMQQTLPHMARVVTAGR